eukprot:gnl/Dysnectes_brevis/4723_a6481_514.p1 GENE.gnl/Dysnectes_brevis/4723_a6481_514~~gnl/Dysnectes_brevis/4723_a6481_514.p1  ORF type:complete len:326 (+),score=69.86 gnl/Dysnectes_brevis/4723_a6481_514:312-1289(+)
MEQVNLWLDCDPGHDDMIALILSLFHPKINLLGVSTVHGNQTVEKTFVNARRTLALVGKPDAVPVYKGFAEPIKRKSIVCPEIHGESGLGGLDWSVVDKLVPKTLVTEHSDFMDAIHHHVTEFGHITLVATACWTNLAMYFRKYPEDASKVRVVCMGGSFKVIGNVGSWAEFNMLVDPEAVREVSQKVTEPVAFIPLDVTHTVLCDDMVFSRLAEMGEFGVKISALLNFFRETYLKTFGFEAPPLHDPLAVLYVIAPELFVVERVPVAIECEGAHTAGATCADWYGYGLVGAKEAEVCLKVDVPAFWDILFEALAAAYESSKTTE